MHHHKKSFIIAEHIIRSLEGNLSDDEKQQLNNWINADAQNEQLFEKLKTGSYLKQELSLMNSFDEQKAFEKISKIVSRKASVFPGKKRRLRSVFRGAAAAAVLFAIAAGIFFLNFPGKPTRNIVRINKIPAPAEEKINPGGNMATLTLSDGSVISLNDSENGVLTKEGNVDIVKLRDGQITYGKSGSSLMDLHYNVVTTPRGGKYNLTLSDGTKVWLNAASSLRFPASFNGAERKVEMEGEAYFEIAKDLKHPFIVLANGAEILVTGTEFNVNAYRDEPSMKITLLEGKVSLKNKQDYTNLSPGEQAEIAEAGKFILHKTIDLEEVIAWKEGLFYFKKADMRTVLKEISRWYDVEVEFKNVGKRSVFKGEIQRDLELSQVIKILKKHHINIELSGRKMIVNY